MKIKRKSRNYLEEMKDNFENNLKTTRDNNDTKNNYENKVNELKDEIEKLKQLDKDNNNEKDEKINKLNQDIAQLTKDKIDLQNKNQSLNDELDKEKGELKQQLEDVNNEKLIGEDDENINIVIKKMENKIEKYVDKKLSQLHLQINKLNDIFSIESYFEQKEIKMKRFINIPYINKKTIYVKNYSNEIYDDLINEINKEYKELK